MVATGEAPTQAFAARLLAAGYHGLLVRSFAHGASDDDLNLVLWRWGDAAPCQLTLIDDEGRLSGIFTDSDLARLLEGKRDAAIDGPLSDVMTKSPSTVLIGQPLSHACDLLAQRKISELPVVDAAGKPVGMIDITDVLGIEPEAGEVQGPKSKVQGRSASFRLLTPDS